MTTTYKLRPIDIRPVRHQGQTALLLRDPLALSDQTLVLPTQLAPLLPLLDGTRDEGALRAALEVRAGVRLRPDVLANLLAQLDRTFLLDNERSEEAMAETLRAYHAAPHRHTTLAGQGYPAEPDQLERLLQGCVDAAPPRSADLSSREPIRGLISPHIDFQRGHTVYAQVWREAAQVAREAELAVILGTDHMSETGSLTLTRQSYATPWGTLPTAQLITERVSQAMGQSAAFEYELHHRTEHSVELAAIWLHFMRGGKEIPLVPILCGSLAPLFHDNRYPEALPHVSAALEALVGIMDRYRTLVIAAGDLAHIGPAFGDSLPADSLARARLKASDEELIDVICTGEAQTFFDRVKRQNHHRICGLSPIYLALQLLGPCHGTAVGYAQCPADNRGTSLVSICGILLH
jgi:AmmeMemoRadiSam system protein B